MSLNFTKRKKVNCRVSKDSFVISKTAADFPCLFRHFRFDDSESEANERKESSSSFLLPAVNLARRLSMRISGNRGEAVVLQRNRISGNRASRFREREYQGTENESAVLF